MNKQNRLGQRARVNITVDVLSNGTKQRKELPLKLLVLGEFSSKENDSNHYHQKRISINQTNFNQVMASLKPSVTLNLDNEENQNSFPPVHLEFSCLNDFHPESIVNQVPALQKLLGMRNLLKDLKANLSDNQVVRKQLEVLLQSNENLQKMTEELKQIASNKME